MTQDTAGNKVLLQQAIDAFIDTLPVGAQANIRDSAKRNESLTVDAFKAGYCAAIAQPEQPADHIEDVRGMVRPATLAAYQGPKKWADEEVENGNVGIRWVTETYVAGRPTSHDLMEYLLRRGQDAFCGCEKCKALFRPTAPVVPANQQSVYFIKGWDACRAHEGLTCNVDSDAAMRERMPATSPQWAAPAQATELVGMGMEKSVIDFIAGRGGNSSEFVSVTLYKHRWRAIVRALSRPTAPKEKPAAWVLFRKDDDGLEPIMFYGGAEKPAGEFKEKFELRGVRLIDEAAPTEPDCLHDETERLGAIWTRCTQCGKKWADDEKPTKGWSS